MKKIKFILAAVIIAATSLSVFAQEDGNRDANGYVVRGPYLTNGAGSNWFVGIGGGFDTSFGNEIEPFGEFKVRNNWTAEAFVGKWFTPTIGVRAGYKGGVDNIAYDKLVNFGMLNHHPYLSGEPFHYGYAHGDFMWNVSNAIGGYKETRFWDFVPYVGAGYLGVNNGRTDNKFGLNAGLYNKIRLGKVVNIYLDVNVIACENPVTVRSIDTGVKVTGKTVPLIARPLYMPSATIGVVFNLGKRKNFDRYSSVIPKPLPFTVDGYNRLGARVDELEKENEELKNKLFDCESKEPEKVIVKEQVRVLVGSNIITFNIGSCVLTETERAKVEAFAKSIDAETLVQVVGSADSKTGTETRNYALSKNRANVVKNELIKNGIKEDHIVTDFKLDATDNVKTSRSAIITLSE